MICDRYKAGFSAHAGNAIHKKKGPHCENAVHFIQVNGIFAIKPFYNLCRLFIALDFHDKTVLADQQRADTLHQGHDEPGPQC